MPNHSTGRVASVDVFESVTTKLALGLGAAGSMTCTQLLKRWLAAYREGSTLRCRTRTGPTRSEVRSRSAANWHRQSRLATRRSWRTCSASKESGTSSRTSHSRREYPPCHLWRRSLDYPFQLHAQRVSISCSSSWGPAGSSTSSSWAGSRWSRKRRHRAAVYGDRNIHDACVRDNSCVEDWSPASARSEGAVRAARLEAGTAARPHARNGRARRAQWRAAYR